MTPRQLSILRTALPIMALSVMIVLSSTAVHACACCGTFRVANVAHWDVLNVRSGPGVRYQIIHTLQPDEGCIVQTGERHGNWVRIQSGNFTGWVNSRYLAYIP